MIQYQVAHPNTKKLDWTLLLRSSLIVNRSFNCCDFLEGNVNLHRDDWTGAFCHLLTMGSSSNKVNCHPIQYT